MRTLLLSLTLLGCTTPYAQSPLGVWKTIQEDTGKPKSYVEIFNQDGTYFGRILEVLDEAYISVCRKCEGDKHNQPIEGLVIIEDMESARSKHKWRGGTVLDPETGKVFRFSMWFEEGKTNELKVRGMHWTGLYRTQTWERASAYSPR